MKPCGWVKVKPLLFLNSALNKVEWLASRPGRFTSGRKTSTYWIRGCLGHRAKFDPLEYSQPWRSCWESKHYSPAVQPVAWSLHQSHYSGTHRPTKNIKQRASIFIQQDVKTSKAVKTHLHAFLNGCDVRIAVCFTCWALYSWRKKLRFPLIGTWVRHRASLNAMAEMNNSWPRRELYPSH